MTPQLFINYKLKSVAHLPWRMLTYKALNTFIDDMFAFVIKMPTMYRIGCFRDGECSGLIRQSVVCVTCTSSCFQNLIFIGLNLLLYTSFVTLMVHVAVYAGVCPIGVFCYIIFYSSIGHVNNSLILSQSNMAVLCTVRSIMSINVMLQPNTCIHQTKCTQKRRDQLYTLDSSSSCFVG